MSDYIFFGYNGEEFDPANPPRTEAITGHDFPLLFCGTNYRRTAENHDHVLAAEINWSRFMYGESLEAAQDFGLDMPGFRAAYAETVAAAGMSGLPPFADAALWNAVAYDERPTNEEEETLLAALRMDDPDDLYWIMRGLRHRLAVRMGFFGSLSDDDYQPLTISPEAFSSMEWREVTCDPEEDE